MSMPAVFRPDVNRSSSGGVPPVATGALGVALPTALPASTPALLAVPTVALSKLFFTALPQLVGLPVL